MASTVHFPFRVGATSYIIPGDLVENVRYLAEQVDDIELVLFDLDSGESNLPDAPTCRELVRLAARHNLSYTVHLPLDLRLEEDGSPEHISLLKAQKVIQAVSDLAPFAYIAHLDGRQIQGQTIGKSFETWVEHSLLALEWVKKLILPPAVLALENLDHYPVETWEPVFAHINLPQCIDIGHLWRDGYDPLPYLEKHLSRARVLHLHGVSGSDHQSLRHIPSHELRRVMQTVIRSNFSGVLTMEIFGEDDFITSLESLYRAVR